MSFLRTKGLCVSLLLTAASVSLAQMPPDKVVVAQAEIRSVTRTIELVGTVDPARRSRVCSEIEGLVVDMPARQGDEVPAGGVLCHLNDDVLSNRLAEAKGNLASLQAYHEELLAGTRDEELRRLKAVLDEAAAEVVRWEFEIKRVEGLYEGSQSNAKEVVDARADYEAAKRRHAAAQAEYDMGVAGPRIQTIARAAFEVAAQQAVVDRIASDLAKATIRAPFGGHVVDRTVEVGEWLAAGAQVVELVELTRVLVRVDAPESAMPYLMVGGQARVKLDALGRSVVGEIRHVIPQADPRARTFPIEIELANSDGRMAAGMFARATVPAGPSTEAVAVPKDAIVEQDGINYVAMVIPGAQSGWSAMLTPVTLGAEIEDWIAITSGNLPPGMQVVTRGNENMMPFPKPVLIVDENGTPVAPSVPAGVESQGGGR